MMASYNPFRRLFFLSFTGYQPVLSGQQSFQGLMGVQQSAHSQGVMSSQQGAPVHGVMVSYPTMSSYQVCASSGENPGRKLMLVKTEAIGSCRCGAISRVMDG